LDGIFFRVANLKQNLIFV
jgi:hypothetical protein